MNRITLLSICAGSLAAGYPADAAAERLKPGQKLTPEHFQRKAQVKDDAMETVATITTSAGFVTYHTILSGEPGDNYIRAFIDKKSGEVQYQLYQTIEYRGDWLRFDQVNFESASGLKSIPTTVISRDVGDCRYGCTFSETLGVDLTAADLKAVADKYEPLGGTAWRFRFKSQGGVDQDVTVWPAEAAGMLAAVAAYQGK